MVSKSYSMVNDFPLGNSGTGLDQILDQIGRDSGLAGASLGSNIVNGMLAADNLNKLIIEAKLAIGVASNGIFTVNDVVAINEWIRQNRLTEFTLLHGDDNGGLETGFHLIQNNGAIQRYRGQNLINTVFDGIYHIGFEIQNGSFVNEDGDANATVQQVADWLTQFFTDRATTNTGLDLITEAIIADPGLAEKISWQDIADGADAANGINQLYATAINELHLADDHWISTEDIEAINQWIREDNSRYNLFVELHGDDEQGLETGFHKVQNDGAKTIIFGKNLVNTVADGIYHIGFEIQDEVFRNEDGNANATISDVADWVTYFYIDQSNTGTGLDLIVDTIKIDSGLAKWTSAEDINRGASAANELNHLIVEAIQSTQVGDDNWLTPDDVRSINHWIRENHYDSFLELHGDDEDGLETGYHYVQNDGAKTLYFGKNLINNVADSIYHIGFEIQGNNLLNEDGDINASLSDVASWLNYFYGQKTLVYGSNSQDVILGSESDEHILGYGGNDSVSAGAGNDLLEGDWGRDHLFGDAGDDIFYGGGDDDTMDGGEGSDTYYAKGYLDESWEYFQGFDLYVDSGTSGIDKIVALGDGNVDIGLFGFDASSGIEIIDGSGVAGIVRLLGNWESNILDFSLVQLVGNHFQIEGGWGQDLILGSQGHDSILGGGDDDFLDGGEGSDVYFAIGFLDENWESFQGFDVYSDSGTSGIDKIVALGTGNVDIGLFGFDASSGIEIIDGSGVAGIVRLLGNWESNILDFSSVQLVGNNFQIEGGWGQDLILGSQGHDSILGGGDDDVLDGGEGSDVYFAIGFLDENWESFQGFDVYSDSGTGGIDKIVALGTDNVDIGLFGFGASSGLEIIDGSGVAGIVRLLGNWESNTLDFSSVQLLGSNILIDGDSGNDTITGSQGNDTINGGSGDDRLNGGQGADDYIVTGNEAEGWSSFQGYDTYNDRGTSGSDRILAVGAGNVDIGLRNFAPTNGIEIIDASGAIGTVRLLGNWEANNLNFSAVSINGGNLRIDGAGGNDTLTGSQGKDIIVGGDGADKLIGGLGADQLTGGKGKDQFTFLSVADIGLPLSGQDTITDFISGQDLVDLMSIDANTLIAGNQAFAYIGSAAFGGQAGQLRFSSGLLAGDINGDQVSDFELLLTNVTTLKATDIRL